MKEVNKPEQFGEGMRPQPEFADADPERHEGQASQHRGLNYPWGRPRTRPQIVASTTVSMSIFPFLFVLNSWDSSGWGTLAGAAIYFAVYLLLLYQGPRVFAALGPRPAEVVFWVVNVLLVVAFPLAVAILVPEIWVIALIFFVVMAAAQSVWVRRFYGLPA